MNCPVQRIAGVRGVHFAAKTILAIAIGLGWAAGPALADECEECCFPGSVWGDGSDGVLEVTGHVILQRDMDFLDLTVSYGATLDTASFTVRVCGTLTNYGAITDNQCGGVGGDGGDGGLGADPTGIHPEHCGPRIETCTPGHPGGPGQPGCKPQAGRGGDGGCGGGGGGGAWRFNADADGGNGGDGGDGGDGGGYVLIYAYHFDNAGLIHADAEDGQDGEDAPNGYNNCGAEYYEYPEGLPLYDLAGGGGGGGTGGDGGEGGTVEIYYAHLGAEGELSVEGGDGGGPGEGGDGHWLHHAHLGNASEGCEDGCSHPNNGHGGDGEWRKDECSEDGENGLPGSNGAPGTIIFARLLGADCNNNDNPDDCDIHCGLSQDENGNGIPDECEPYKVIDVGTIGADLYSKAWGLNDLAEITGWSGHILSPSDHGFHACKCETPTYLPPLPDHDFTCAYDIAGSSEPVGWSWTGPVPLTEDEERLAVRWQNGIAVDLGCSNPSQAWGVNDLGQIVGMTGLDVMSGAFLWLPEPACGLPEGCNSINMPDAPPYFVCQSHKAFAINEQSNVVGWSYCVLYPPLEEGPAIVWETWLWECETDQWYTVREYGEPRDLNNLNQVVGHDTLNSNDAYLCSPDGLWDWDCEDLPGLGGEESCANAINDAGEIVGWAQISDEVTHACIWRDGNVNDLHDLLRGQCGEGWELVEATDINECGQISGWGTLNGETRAFLLNPCPADINWDCIVNTEDLLRLLGAWGACPPPCPPSCAEDINCDCLVNTADLLDLLGHWGDCP